MATAWLSAADWQHALHWRQKQPPAGDFITSAAELWAAGGGRHAATQWCHVATSFRVCVPSAICTPLREQRGYVFSPRLLRSLWSQSTPNSAVTDRAYGARVPTSAASSAASSPSDHVSAHKGFTFWAPVSANGAGTPSIEHSGQQTLLLLVWGLWLQLRATNNGIIAIVIMVP